MAVEVVSKHAWERLKQRRGAKREEHVCNKIKRWSSGLPDDGIFYRDRIAYVVKDKILITAYQCDEKRAVRGGYTLIDNDGEIMKGEL